MRCIALLFTIFITALTATSAAYAQNSPTSEQLENIVEYLRVQPATVYGDIQTTRTTILPARAGKPTVRLNARFPIGYNLTENYLNLSMSAGEPGPMTLIIPSPLPQVPLLPGLATVSLASQLLPRQLEIRINNIGVDAQGNFRVDVETPLGVGSDFVENKVKKALEEKFKVKMQQAFAHLRRLRQQRNIGDAQQVINTILGIITARNPNDPPGPDLNMLPVEGNVNLEINPTANRTLNVNGLNMDITGGDRISAGVEFNRTRGIVQLNSINLISSQGIVFRGEGSRPNTIMSARVTGIHIDENGLRPTYVTGPEEAIGGIRLIAATLLAYQGGADMTTGAICDDIRIGPLQNWLNCQLNGRLAILMREHRQQLLDAGVRQQIVSVLLNPTNIPGNCNTSRQP